MRDGTKDFTIKPGQFETVALYNGRMYLDGRERVNWHRMKN